MSELLRVCAWCHPGAASPGITHGICEEHAAELLREVKIRRISLASSASAPQAKRSSNLTPSEVSPC